MKRLLSILRKIYIVFIIIFLTSVTNYVYADSNGKGNGADNGKGKGREEQSEKENQGNAKGKGDHGNSENSVEKSRSQEHSSRSSNNGESSASSVSNTQRRHIIEKARTQADVRANRPERGANGKSAEHIRINQTKNIKDNLPKAIEKARWSYNPNDERGQGNMGKVDMRDPYGFDKDSGREKSERGRAIHEKEPVLDLASLLSLSAHIDDPWYLTLLQQVNFWLQQANNPSPYYSQNTIQYYLSYWQNRLANYTLPTYDKVWVGNTSLPKTIYYSLDVSGLPETFEGTNLLVTMTLTSINDYTENFSFVDWSRRATAGEPNYYGWPIVTVTYNYDAGQVAAEYTQEITLNGDETYNFSYQPPTELSVGPKGGYFQLAVTVTDPVSGASYTMTYDRQILILRCPYGKVTDAKTSKSVVGAKVTVHYEDGSLVPLDKAANPNAANPQITDATGRYGFKLQTGRNYYISATAPGYEEYKSPVFTEKWHVLREDIKLNPLAK